MLLNWKLLFTSSLLFYFLSLIKIVEQVVAVEIKSDPSVDEPSSFKDDKNDDRTFVHDNQRDGIYLIFFIHLQINIY